LASIAKITEQGILEILEIARKHIINAKHIINKGFAAVRMQEIADDAGINKAMLHYYFC
jgi:AcrR family transcriptional regulator